MGDFTHMKNAGYVSCGEDVVFHHSAAYNMDVPEALDGMRLGKGGKLNQNKYE